MSNHRELLWASTLIQASGIQGLDKFEKAVQEKILDLVDHTLAKQAERSTSSPEQLVREAQKLLNTHETDPSKLASLVGPIVPERSSFPLSIDRTSHTQIDVLRCSPVRWPCHHVCPTWCCSC